MGELFTKSAPIIKREAHKKTPLAACGQAWVRYTVCGLQIIGCARLRPAGYAVASRCRTCLTCLTKLGRRKTQSARVVCNLTPSGLRADTLLIPAVAHCPQGFIFWRFALVFCASRFIMGALFVKSSPIPPAKTFHACCASCS